MKTIKKIILLLMLVAGQDAIGQNNDLETAAAKGKQAIQLMDNGKIEESIVLLKEAQKLDPKNVNYPYELAFAHYLKQDYKSAIKFLEGIKNHKNVNHRVYQLLGNSYDYSGKSEKAQLIYEEGLKLFPNSGSLYLEMGVLLIGKEEYNKALGKFEKGIEVDPKFPSNYYWASKLYLNSTEEVWGMIYGEIFMNLERNSKRTAEISKLLYDTYKSQIQFPSDTSSSVSFSQNATIQISDLSDMSNFKLPFGVGVYEPTLLISLMSVRTININTLDTIRTNFVKYYFEMEHQKKYPNILMDYQKEIVEAGQFEAYNHWLLNNGEPEAFQNWQKDNADKWNNFIVWFKSNGIELNESNKFSRFQY